MGGTTSKIEAPTFAPDYSKAQFSAEYVQTAMDKATALAQAQAEEASQQISGLGSWVAGLTGISSILFIALIAVGIYYLLYWFKVVPSFFGLQVTTPAAPNIPDLAIHSAMLPATDKSPAKDISSDLQNLVKDSALNTTITAPGIKSLSSTDSGPTTITYQYSGCPVETITPNIGDPISITYDATKCPSNTQSTAPPTTRSTGPGWFSSMFAGTGSSGTLVSSIPDATASSIVKATSAPLSSGGSGSYGMQWWMFIKDWNYGYGKDKQVLARADPTNSQILNPSVALHPTDNTLRVTVSIFPDNSGGSSKTQPAPAGHSASTDDVFVCEVPNLPLQDWFSVSMTVFERNLDIYIDGKLVKSCFLPGVPKPASGDITLAGNGGFSGSLCGFTHYSRMLTPGDATSFYSAGTSCKSFTGPSTASTATGYAVKFGVYDTVGKKIQEYTF